MNSGDTIKIVLDYTIDGAPIREGDVDELEFTLGTKRYTLSNNDISWDNSLSAYTVFISQQDSLKLSKRPMYQLRIKIGEDVISSQRNVLILGDSLSKEVL